MFVLFLLAWVALVVIDAAGWVLLPTLVIVLPLLIAVGWFALSLLFVGGVVAALFASERKRR